MLWAARLEGWSHRKSLKLRVSGTGYGAVEFGVWSVGLQSCFGLSFPHCAPLLPSWNGHFYSVLYVRSM